jgi:response regulator RpfG family c-di-GMP phosphodiesterase
MVPRGVLLIDDDFTEIIAFQRYLAELHLDHTLHIADNVNDALKILNSADESSAPSLVLINLETDNLNAVEFLKVLRSHYSQNVKVFALTEKKDPKIDVKSWDITAILRRPIDLSFPKDLISFSNYNLLLNALVR